MSTIDDNRKLSRCCDSPSTLSISTTKGRRNLCNNCGEPFIPKYDPRMAIEVKEEKECNCETQLCKHFESDFDRFVKKEKLKKEFWELWKMEGGDWYEDFSNDTRPMTAENMPRIGRKYIRTDGVLIQLEKITNIIEIILDAHQSALLGKLKNHPNTYEDDEALVFRTTMKEVINLVKDEKNYYQ